MNAINDTRLEVIGFGAVPASVDEQRSIARELISLRAQLAELRGQEPVAYGINIDGRNIYRDERSLPIYRGTGREITPVYARPVPPAASQHVPDEIPETPDADAEVDAYNKGKMDGWNACRAAMLNSPVIKNDTAADERNKPGVIVAVHVNAGDFVRLQAQVFEVKEADFDDHDVTLWFIGGGVLKCAAGAPIEVVERKDGDA